MLSSSRRKRHAIIPGSEVSWLYLSFFWFLFILFIWGQFSSSCFCPTYFFPYISRVCRTILPYPSQYSAFSFLSRAVQECRLTIIKNGVPIRNKNGWIFFVVAPVKLVSVRVNLYPNPCQLFLTALQLIVQGHLHVLCQPLSFQITSSSSWSNTSLNTYPRYNAIFFCPRSREAFVRNSYYLRYCNITSNSNYIFSLFRFQELSLV